MKKIMCNIWTSDYEDYVTVEFDGVIYSDDEAPAKLMDAKNATYQDNSVANCYLEDV